MQSPNLLEHRSVLSQISCDGATERQHQMTERPKEKRSAPRGAGRPGKKDRPDTGPARSERSGGERIAKRLARAGIASRREAESIIAAGRVSVNGTVLNSPALNVFAEDRIELDGKLIPAIERTRLFLFHKPPGVVTTNRDPQGRKTVFDVLPDTIPRVLTIGRLDINTEGLLLLTNDGGLARVLELPSTGWLRRYRVRVHGRVRQSELDALKDGIAVDGVFYGSVEAVLDREQGSNAWLTVGLREGKNREIKNILGKLGLEVGRLIRLSYGPFQLGDLPAGSVRELKGRTLRDQLGERLIDQAGADFDAPLIPREIESNSQTVQSTEPESRKPEAGRDKVISSSSFKGRKKPEQKKAPEPPRSRSSNVWMAPGARPKRQKGPEMSGKPEGQRGTAGKPASAGSRKPKSAPRSARGAKNADRRR